MSRVEQLSIFIENKAGRANAIFSRLNDANINVLGYMISDTLDYGILRIVTETPQKALRVLNEAGITAQVNEVLVAKLGGRAGDLHNFIRILAEEEINMIYSYSLSSTYVIIRVDNIEEAQDLMLARGIKLVNQEELDEFSNHQAD
ncbi:MAG: hypothetical protein Q4E22_06060 [Coriobacteriia bacterium]|nr:hypothetical protein [Coriobacteriia bacterium]